MFIFLIIPFFLLIALWFFSSYFPCPAWLGWVVERDNPFSRINRAQSIIKNAGIKEGMSVLDAGCGPGRLTIPVAHAVGKNGSVLALDLQKEMLSKVEAKVKEEKLTNVEFLNISLGVGLAPNKTFDRILLITVLGELIKKERSLKELHSLLAPQGVFSITEIIFDPHYQRKNKTIKLVEQCGFVLKDEASDYCAYTLNFIKK